MGIMRVISTSKIKKITAIKKNCMEKGARENNWGLNPHSKGDSFSRSLKDLLPKIELRIIIIMERIKEMKKIMNITFFLETLKLEALCTGYTKNVWTSSINRYI